LGEREEAQNLHPPGKGIRQPGQQKQIGGSGHDEPSRDSPPIDCGFDGSEQLRDSLHFVEDRSLR